MKFAICDDNREYINKTEAYIDKLKDELIDYDIYYSGEELALQYENNKADYDAIFLDMEMEEMNGIETADKIRKIDKHVIIVFVTSHTKYMQESFKCSPFRFLVKPVEFEDFKKVYYEILDKISTDEQFLLIADNKSKLRLRYSDIVYAESRNHCIFIHSKKETYKMRKTMNEFETMIKSYDFVRTHKSFLLNFNYVKKVNKNNVELYECGDLIPVSRSCKREFNTLVEKIIERKYKI